MEAGSGGRGEGGGRGWNNSDPRKAEKHNFLEFSQFLECLDEAMYTRKKSFVALIKFYESNRIYIRTLF